MTDYFALLEQPRMPWLDPAPLKEVFHRKTLEQHPDATAAGSEDRFAELNAAYQALQDPKRRLHHLLSLENRAPAANQMVPQELQELFLEERIQFPRRVFRHLDQTFVADFVIYGRSWRQSIGHGEILICRRRRASQLSLHVVGGDFIDFTQGRNVLEFFAEEFAVGKTF